MSKLFNSYEHMKTNIHHHWFYFVLGVDLKMPPKRKTEQFTAEEDEKLISFIENQPCLYDASHADYKKPLVKEREWKKGAETIGRTGIIGIVYFWRVDRLELLHIETLF